MLAVGDKGALADHPQELDEVDGAAFVARFSVGGDAAYGDEAPTVTAITGDEAKSIADGGFPLVAVSSVPTERVESGEQAGLEDGAADLALWKSVGLERGSAVYVTYLKALTADSPESEGVTAYLTAYEESLASYYVLGLRAPTPTLKVYAGETSELWRGGDLGLNNDGGYEGTLTGPQIRAMTANLLHTSPASLCEFDVPDYNDVKLVVVLRGEAPAEPEKADEEASGTDEDPDGSDDPGGNAVTDYGHLTVAELKEVIEHRNSERDEERHINVTGKKAELVAALEADDLATADAEAAARGAGEDPDGE